MIVFPNFKRISKCQAKKTPRIIKGAIFYMAKAKKNYLNYEPVGQLDPYACWAACLKWWYWAAKSVKKSQRKLIDKYNHLSDEYGAMDNSAIEFIIVDNDMYPWTPARASELTFGELQKMLGWGPVFIAYTETSTNKKHVNVMYELLGNESNAMVRVMEPQAVDNGDWTYTGLHMIKRLSEFNARDTVFCGTL